MKFTKRTRLLLRRSKNFVSFNYFLYISCCLKRTDVFYLIKILFQFKISLTVLDFLSYSKFYKISNNLRNVWVILITSTVSGMCNKFSPHFPIVNKNPNTTERSLQAALTIVVKQKFLRQPCDYKHLVENVLTEEEGSGSGASGSRKPISWFLLMYIFWSFI